MIVGLVAISLCLLCLPGMEWLKLGNAQPVEKQDMESAIDASSSDVALDRRAKLEHA